MDTSDLIVTESGVVDVGTQDNMLREENRDLWFKNMELKHTIKNSWNIGFGAGIVVGLILAEMVWLVIR